MKAELVSDEEQLWNLKEPWKDLQSLGAAKDITTTWQWMSTWWEVFREGRSLALLVVRDGEEVVGIAPFVRRSIRYFGLIPYTRMEFMASGEDEKDEICSDYLDFVIKDGREREVLEAIFEFLHHSRDISWDDLLLPVMRIESPTVPLLFDLAGKFRLTAREIRCIPCRYASLPDSFEEYLSQLGSKTRYKIRRGMRKLSEGGDVDFKIAETAEEVEAAKNILIRLHQSRWSQKGDRGVFSSAKFRLFHDKIMSISHKKNWLRLGILSLSQRPLACIYNLRFNGRVYSYQAGIEVSDNWDLSYGMLAHAYAIAHAISETSREYDFLAGDSEYKKRLAKEEREILTVRISKSSPKESLYRTMCKQKEKLKTVRDRLKKGGQNHK